MNYNRENISPRGNMGNHSMFGEDPYQYPHTYPYPTLSYGYQGYPQRPNQLYQSQHRENPFYGPIKGYYMGESMTKNQHDPRTMHSEKRNHEEDQNLNGIQKEIRILEREHGDLLKNTIEYQKDIIELESNLEKEGKRKRGLSDEILDLEYKNKRLNVVQKGIYKGNHKVIDTIFVESSEIVKRKSSRPFINLVEEEEVLHTISDVHSDKELTGFRSKKDTTPVNNEHMTIAMRSKDTTDYLNYEKTETIIDHAQVIMNPKSTDLEVTTKFKKVPGSFNFNFKETEEEDSDEEDLENKDELPTINFGSYKGLKKIVNVDQTLEWEVSPIYPLSQPVKATINGGSDGIVVSNNFINDKMSLHTKTPNMLVQGNMTHSTLLPENIDQVVWYSKEDGIKLMRSYFEIFDKRRIENLAIRETSNKFKEAYTGFFTILINLESEVLFFVVQREHEETVLGNGIVVFYETKEMMSLFKKGIGRSEFFLKNYLKDHLLCVNKIFSKENSILPFSMMNKKSQEESIRCGMARPFNKPTCVYLKKGYSARWVPCPKKK